MRIFILFFLVIHLFGDTNTTIKSENNSSENNITEQNETLILNEEIIPNIESYGDEIDIAIVLNKKKFFKFIPSLMKSINAYMIKKDINYHIKLFNMDNNLTKDLNNITSDYTYIFAYITNENDIKVLNNYPDNYFFIPTLNKNQIEVNCSDNIFFGGIDYQKQIFKLNKYINGFTTIVYDNSNLSKYITTIIDETLLQPHKIKKYPIKYNLYEYNNSFVYLNTNIVHTAQILSNFTYKKIKPKSIFTTQIDYSPLLFSLTNKEDIQNLIVTNSIFNINPIIEDNNLNLGSEIDFNWLNFTTSVLLNKAYLLETSEEEFFLNDFDLYILFNQVNYKVNLYRIYKNGFIKIK